MRKWIYRWAHGPHYSEHEQILRDYIRSQEERLNDIENYIEKRKKQKKGV